MNQALFDAIDQDSDFSEHLTDLEGRNADGHTPLEYALLKGAQTRAEELLAAGAAPSVSPAVIKQIYAKWEPGQYSPLDLTGYYTLPKLACCLLAAGAPPDDVGSSGYHPIHWAAKNGLTEALTMMLDRGVAVDLCVEDRKATPLVLAVVDNQLANVQLLVARGANVNVTHKKNTLFQLAKKKPRVLAALKGLPLPPDNIERTRAAIAPYLGRHVTAKLDGSLFDHAPATFSFFFDDPKELRSFLKVEYEDETYEWNWDEVVPVARVSYKPSADGAFATLFLDWRRVPDGGTAQVLVTTSDRWDDEVGVESLAALGLNIVAAHGVVLGLQALRCSP
jgi:hypothetical protein